MVKTKKTAPLCYLITPFFEDAESTVALSPEFSERNPASKPKVPHKGETASV
ncbi:MAG: hypothetical protein ACJATX_000447 [Candidatus Paceibacteria bacterium]|jgi:hypothetical protein